MGAINTTGISATGFFIDFTSITPPSLPPYMATNTGNFNTANDGTSNYLQGTSAVAQDSWTIPFGSTNSSLTFKFTIQYPNTSNPVNSYCFPGFNTQTNGLEYEIVMSRGSGELRGALWIQKGINGGTTAILGSPTFVGTSGTTFTQNNKYIVTTIVTGSSTRTINISIQRVSDSNWLKSDGTWQITFQTALSIADSSSPISPFGVTSVSVFDLVTTDARIYDFSFNDAPSQAIRTQSTPILTKGATYDGWQADSLAAPAITQNGSIYAMTVSFWNIAASKWSSGFFTSSDMKSWSYVTGSLVSPGGSDYIVGNSGLAFFGGKYYWAFNHYPNTAIGIKLALNFSTDLIHWTLVADPLQSLGGADPMLVVNPGNSKLELWYMTTNAPRQIHMQDSSDGTTWTDEGNFMPAPIFCAFDYGEPSVYYIGTTRYLTFDMSPIQAGYRYTGLANSASQNTVWLSTGIVNSPVAANAWEAGEVFDADIIITDLGDGLGSIPRAVYAGSDTHSSTDNTDSSIGLFSLKP